MHFVTELIEIIFKNFAQKNSAIIFVYRWGSVTKA